ncbi:MAG: retropepsin-like domain-containing protein [Candidatus Riesia sp.]|nr:retropepsin-like domain-containing protein [Candidatus Riesia sp.]
MELPIQISDFKDGKSLFITATINGKKANLLLDTGASKSVIDSRKLSKYTSDKPLKSFSVSGVNENVETSEINIKRFLLGDKEMKNIYFYVMDLINLNNAFSSNYIKVVDGILGNDVLTELKCVIDLNKMIIF